MRSLAEEEPPLRGHVTIVDAEADQARTRGATARVLAKYRRACAAYLAALREFSTTRGPRLVEGRAAQPFGEFLARALREARILV